MWQVMGASVRGPQHRICGEPNQDAWLGRAGRQHALAVVCDGLGSRGASAQGARAACSSVAEAVRIWTATPGAPEGLLLRLIHAIWNIRVHANGRDASATTCQIAAITPDNRLVLAQLGDGLILLKAGTEVVALEPETKDFSNLTTGLGICSDIRDWRVRVLPAAPAAMVMLATDGIADDLEPTRRSGFMDYLMEEFAGLPAAARSRAIAKALRTWPTPKHADDKTVAVLWRAPKMECP